MPIFESLLFLYLLVNCIIYLIQRWLEKQLNDTPHGKKKLYTECEWFKNPTRIKHKIARKLVEIGLPLYAEAEYLAFVTLGLLIFFALFLAIGSTITTPHAN